LVMGTFFGIFLLVFFHNLFVWISLADRSLFYYLGMICTLGVYHFVYAGYALEFFWPNAPYWADRAPLFFSSIAQLWGFLFCRSFLNLNRYAPRLDRLVGAAAVVSALTALATLTLGYTFAAQLILVLSTFSMITHLITGGIARWRGYAPARHYILAAVMMLSGGVLSIIMHLGWIPEIWPARYGFQLGSLWLVLFFSFAISDRVHHLRLKAEAARAEAVNHLNEVTRLRDSFVANLQSQVDARTAELRKFQLAVEQSPAIIIITDAKGVIEYVNRSFCEQTGYSFAEARGSTPALLKSETHDADTFTRLWRTISSGAVWRGELHNRRKDGELRWVSSMIAPLRDTDGGITHYIGISEDISKRKSLERLRSETANIIHHDLKNPASSILGLSELLLEDHPEIAGESREYVRMIEQSAGKLLRRLSYLLDLQRIEAGEYLLQPERVNLAALLRDALLDLEATRKMYAVDIHIEITGRSLPELNDYPLRGEQVLLASLFGNLLLNALEASPRNGQVRVAVEKADSGHSISIHNQGAIPEEVRDRFFDPYVTGRKTGGTGLGTYAALLIARLHGGRISYTTSSDDGTRLVVFLPDNIPVDIGNLP
ncbi:MAG: PAS domain S-box protein, partial [Leptospiraceae bacterium]|nr:PAS domain S-box protein [Leptospiraceae bacterium]